MKVIRIVSGNVVMTVLMVVCMPVLGVHYTIAKPKCTTTSSLLPGRPRPLYSTRAVSQKHTHTEQQVRVDGRTESIKLIHYYGPLSCGQRIQMVHEKNQQVCCSCSPFLATQVVVSVRNGGHCCSSWCSLSSTSWPKRCTQRRCLQADEVVSSLDHNNRPNFN